MEDLRPYNENNERHGYWEGYYDKQLQFKGHFYNGKQIGFWEYYTIRVGGIRLRQYFV